MASKTIYTCDRCHADVSAGGLIWVRLHAGQEYGYQGHQENYERLQLSSQWCVKCCEQNGLDLKPRDEKKPAPRKSETEQSHALEDLIREIVRAEIKNPTT